MCRSTCFSRRPTRQPVVGCSILPKPGPVFHPRAAPRHRPGVPIHQPAPARKSRPTNPRRRFCVSPTSTAMCSPRHPVMERLADRSCREQGFCHPCGGRGVTPASIIRAAWDPDASRACRRTWLSRSATAHWSCPLDPRAARCSARRCCRCSSNQAVFGMDPQSAVEAPRFASYSWPELTLPHTYRPGARCVEPGMKRTNCERWVT